MKTRYLVMNENALCYIRDGWTLAGVLAGDTLNYGPDKMRGSIALPAPGGPGTMREATEADFDRFRVCSKGYAIAKQNRT